MAGAVGVPESVREFVAFCAAGGEAEDCVLFCGGDDGLGWLGVMVELLL